MDDLARELRTQAAFLRDREPVYDRVIALLPAVLQGEFGGRLARVWAHRTFNASYERPLLLLAAIRYDALCEGPAHPLWDALGGGDADAAAVTAYALQAALAPQRARLEQALRDRFVQTNETSRAVAWLWPAHLIADVVGDRAIALVDLGTSAGLNLIADRLPPLWSDERGAPLAVAPRPAVATRLGLDIAPLDVRRESEATWLRACVWPSDRARRGRLDEAIRLFTTTAGSDAPVLEACALQRAPDRLRALSHDSFVLCFQTVVRDYLSPADQARFHDRMDEWLLSRPPRSALVAELEVDAARLDVAAESATLVLRFAGASRDACELLVARTHPHPRRLFRQAAAVDALRAAFATAGV